MKKLLLILIPTIYGIIIHYGWNNYPAIVIAIGFSLIILMIDMLLDLMDY